MHPTVRDALERREYARAIGDTGLERGCNADLARFGIHGEPKEMAVATMPEQERAVPLAPRRGRKPLPRCEHGQIADRCTQCEQED